MKTRLHTATLAILAATILLASGATVIGQQGMMDMSAMKREPHHLLAMAYKDNLVDFAKTLRQEAAETKTVNPEFARAAVAEMKRSFDQMQEHHQDHMKVMDDKTKAPTAETMKQMEAHHAAIRAHLAALDKEVHTAAPDSKNISEHVAEILKQCDGMSTMHGAMTDHKMGESESHKMN